ncbi:MAG: CRISPR-associated helicase Cas3', partial [Clostridia bacterium]|nr:CRISPR-associated helicase Cas3' [Clostridia bacterium]
MSITNKIAHINSLTNEVQTIKDHSLCTAEMAKNFSVAELKPLVYSLSLLHDIGKYQPSFQERINGKNIRAEHSTCGAIEAKKLFGKGVSSMIAQYCIAGHHSGIPNGGNFADTKDDVTLQGRLKREFEDYSDYKSELTVEKPDEKAVKKYMSKTAKDNESLIETFAFIARYCFSCLTDADSLDTAEFCTGRKDIELTSEFKECLDKINEKIASFKAETELQKARSIVQAQAYEKVGEDANVYLMNMPTGSGKTLCSMKFALERAIKTGKRRIIYVIPYNSIIDQTVSIFEDIFGDSAQILRHQSSFCIDDTDNSEEYKALLKNVTENWNAQIIVTTSVQFFESIYANKRNKLRKIHNMADSIIIFDEAHMMPTQYLQPCLRAVSLVTKLINSEAVFLTATMPDFEQLIKQYSMPETSIKSLIEDKSRFASFKKGDFLNVGDISEEGLLEQAMQKPAALIVVNKRSTAAKLYDLLTDSVGEKYHLSTYMTAFDRKRVIDEIKKKLDALYKEYPDPEKAPPSRRIIVVSTSLIEAGVDLDFFTVYRELSGLDSILQAGGRCNREGKRRNAAVYIFNFGKPSTDARVNTAKALLEKYDDISSPE